MNIYLKWGVGIAAVAGIAFAYQATTAKAADLGGNCCADLEERVAELEATVSKKGNRKVTLVISGQISKAILYHDIAFLNGTDKARIIDNPNSGSRVSLAGSAKTGVGTSVGFLLELGYDDTAGNGLGIARDDLTIRHSAAWLETGLGRVTLGRTSTATDGIVEIDLSNSNIASLPMSVEPIWTYSGLAGVAGGLLNPTPFDGSRANIVRYDSPTVAGFVASAAWGGGTTASGDDVWDVALRHASEVAGFRFAGGVGYRSDGYEAFTGTQAKTLAGSASALHTATGIFVTLAAAKQTDNPVFGDMQMWQARAGLERNFFGIGATTLFAEYGAHKLTSINVDSNFMGGGVVQAIDAGAMDVFLNIRSYEIGGTYDATVGMAGVKIRF